MLVKRRMKAREDGPGGPKGAKDEKELSTEDV